MQRFDINFATVVKLIIWSTVVGAGLYWLEWSTGEVFGWAANKIAYAWAWIADIGFKYMLLGATIVVPIFLISRLRKR
ncbi:MAG: hypothetical protein JKY60_01930 [Kordiimonadaceae bacterium]|nr:hypothetical protein [Kordiimonadaceae bacterium]